MILSLDKSELQEYTSRQLNCFFPDKLQIDLKQFDSIFDIAIDRLNYCFEKVAFERYNKNGSTLFNHLYADHYLMYIWFLSNTFRKEIDDRAIASKLYYLNKTLHGFDCMYDTKLPDIFLVFHGVGTMLGKAEYANYFVALQGCTIGSHKGQYPKMGQGVSLTAHSSIIGNCTIGNNVSISAYTNIFQTDIADNYVAYRNKKGEIISSSANVPYAQQFFNVDLNLVAKI
jgi:serine O-acetyltransferase